MLGNRKLLLALYSLVEAIEGCREQLKLINGNLLVDKKFTQVNGMGAFLVEREKPVLSMDELLEIESFAKACIEEDMKKKDICQK